MAVVFVLGPSEWDPARGKSRGVTPRAVRETICETLRAHDHGAFLMEERPDPPGRDMVGKFEHLLVSERVSDILVYWPARAKMQTTYDELILLRAWADERALPRIWVLHEATVARITRGRFEVLEKGGRSRYLEAVARLGVTPVAWTGHDELPGLVARLAAEL